MNISPTLSINVGDVLMDASSFESAFNVIYSGNKVIAFGKAVECLAQFIQSTVIHNRILIEPSSFDAHMRGGLFSLLGNLDISDLVLPIQISSENLRKISTVAENKANTVVSELPENIKSSLTHYGLAESKLYSTNLKSEALLEKIASRTYLYYAISCFLGVPYIPNVYRAPLIEHEVRTQFHYQKVANAALNSVENSAREIADLRNSLLGSAVFTLEFPSIFLYVMSKVKQSWSEVIPIALELRESREASAFRDLCSEIALSAQNGDLSQLAQTLDDLQKQSRIWRQEIDSPSVDIAIAIPLGIEFSLNQLWEYFKQKKKLHIVFLDKLMREASQSNALWKKINLLKPA